MLHLKREKAFVLPKLSASIEGWISEKEKQDKFISY